MPGRIPGRSRFLALGIVVVVLAGVTLTWRPGAAPQTSRAYPAPRCPSAGAADPETPLEAGEPFVFTVGTAGEIERDGTWLRDASGRYVLLRGVNLASRSKRPPYLPVLPIATTTLDPAAVARELERLQPELCRLQDLGVNVVRLLVMWKAIEPEHDDAARDLAPRGRAYLEAVRQVIDALYFRHGVFVIVDFHQDVASEAYGGDGFPDWAVAVDEHHPRPLLPPPPNELWGARYYELPGNAAAAGVRHTLRSFWRNRLTNVEAGLVDHPVRTHLARTIGRTARFFSGHPAVLGYEPFNEPHQAGIDKAEFERDLLGAFYDEVRAEVAAGDGRAFLFLEPRLDWATYPADAPEPTFFRPWSFLGFTDGARTFLDIARLGRDARVVLAFHYYDPWLVSDLPLGRSLARRARAWPAMFASMSAAVRSQGAVPFLTEFGCSQDWTRRPDLEPDAYGTVARACMDLQYREVDANLLSATYWNYDFYSRRGEGGKISENWNLENLSLLGPDGPQNMDVAARPYPMRSSARPELVRFDLTSKLAAVVLAGQTVEAPTVLFVPARMHYAKRGFDVRATASRAPIWDEQRQLLLWWPRRGPRPNVLVLSPHAAFDASEVPPAARELLAEAQLWPFAADP